MKKKTVLMAREKIFMNEPEEITRTIRLNQFLAQAGVGSRRDADALILSGQVTINGQKAESLVTRIDPEKDAVKVAGRRFKTDAHKVYILLNKPEGILSTLEDPHRRMNVVDLIKGVKARIFPVGRLDYNTSGVLLMTNDGECALRLTHPRFGFPKTYHAKVQAVPSSQALLRMARGVHIPNWSGHYEKSLPAKVHLLQKFSRNALLEITVREGRKHQVRHMCAAIGHPVIKLTRVKFGFLSAAGLRPGEWRYLTPPEIERLKKMSHAGEGERKAA